MKIIRSSRHQKIIGDFGEMLLCNWFSRSGFEVTLVDHTGIDVVAYNPKTRQRLGVSVKSRTRIEEREKSSITVFVTQKNDRQKMLDACKAFACDPWIATYVETTLFADLYLTSLENYDKKYRGENIHVVDDWKMTEKYKKRYEEDSKVKIIHMDFSNNTWEWP